MRYRILLLLSCPFFFTVWTVFTVIFVPLLILFKLYIKKEKKRNY